MISSAMLVQSEKLDAAPKHWLSKEHPIDIFFVRPLAFNLHKYTTLACSHKTRSYSGLRLEKVLPELQSFECIVNTGFTQSSSINGAQSTYGLNVTYICKSKTEAAKPLAIHTSADGVFLSIISVLDTLYGDNVTCGAQCKQALGCFSCFVS
jgi:hypothetical protein